MEPPKQAAATPPAKEPIAVLVDQIAAILPTIRESNPALARRVSELVSEAPRNLNKPEFRQQMAYALEDIEKGRVGSLVVDLNLRKEMTALASTAPGLRNPQMLRLMKETAGVNDEILVQDIRATAADIGRRFVQGGPDETSRINALESRTRLARRAGTAGDVATEPPGTAEARNTTAGDQATRERRAADTSVNQPPLSGANAAGTTSARTAAANSGGGDGQVFKPGALDTLLRIANRLTQPSGGPGDVDPPQTDMGRRLADFEKRMTDQNDARAMERAQKSGTAAVNALQAFTNGEGAQIMSRIQTAARTDPEGMSGVLSEMREGGRFADLRRQFNSALEHDKGMAGAYEKAAKALDQFGKDRGIVADKAAIRGDVSAVNARFETIDSEIGKAAGQIPSKKDGKSMMDDLAEKIAEIVNRAVQNVRDFFTQRPSASHSASPSPG